MIRTYSSRTLSRLAAVCAGAILISTSMSHAQPLKDARLQDVKLTEGFWKARMDANRAVTVWHNFKMCEETGRIRNFERAAGKIGGDHEGIYFNDSDVYKVMEGASYLLASQPDEKLDRYMDDLIATMAAAQRPDGYLYTFYQIKGLDQRFTNLKDKHELYCAGHLIEAGVAHHAATGKRSLLNIAIKWADLIDNTFGPGKRYDVDGHEEIEIALIRLADATGEEKYRKLAEFFIAERGRGTDRKLYGEYYQDHKPLAQCTTVVGHAVRQMYLLCAAADLALRGDKTYQPALERMWEDMTASKLYITGGVGAKHEGEAFGDAFELPNESAYAETCAGIGNALWSHRMNLLTGDSKYADVVERATYNGFLSGVSLKGDRFFYVNPLASRGNHHRVPWFDCACCPPNVVRYMATVPQRAYAIGDDNTIYVNLYAAGKATLGDTKLTQDTRYPWDGKVKVTIEQASASARAMKFRIPEWSDGATLKVNGQSQPTDLDKGYATVSRAWKQGDVIELDLPMPIRRVKADPRVKANVGRVALQCGPLVYCVEAVDNNGRVNNLFLPPNSQLKAEHRPDLLGGITVITGKAMARTAESEAPREVQLTAIPYYAWDHRAPGEMAVWLAEDPSVAAVAPKPTIANSSIPSASHHGKGDNLEALFDGAEIKDSNDHEVPRMTFWDHRGTSEWLQYEFREPKTVSAVEVYWFDDERSGRHCRVPQSWRLMYRDNGQWKPVENPSDYGTAADRFNEVTFKPVKTDALRMEIQLQPTWSAGVLEWRVR